MKEKEFPIPDWTKEEFSNLFQRASDGDKISQELVTTLFEKHVLPDLEKIFVEED